MLPRYVNYTVPIPWEQTHSQDGPAVNHMWHMVGEEARSLTLNTAAAQVCRCCGLEASRRGLSNRNRSVR